MTVQLTSYSKSDPDQHRSEQVSGHTFIFSRVLLLGAADPEGAFGQGGEAVVAQQGTPLAGPLYHGRRLTLRLTVEHNGGAGVHHCLHRLHGDGGRT